MLPSSSEIRILRKQSRKGSDVKRNRITRKQKPPRLAVFQKLVWKNCFLWIPWETIFPSHLDPFLFLQFYFRLHAMLLPIWKDGGKNRLLKLCPNSGGPWKKLGPKKSNNVVYFPSSTTRISLKLQLSLEYCCMGRGTLLFYCNCNIVTTEDPSKDALEKTENYANWKSCKVQIVY